MRLGDTMNDNLINASDIREVFVLNGLRSLVIFDLEEWLAEAEQFANEMQEQLESEVS
jgi:hypothetical protein